ncbi:hypothetical protein CVT24_012163 [Panaeolus cyanescens]|uniref:Uncharacterized protein n=1 Tax=Panaeolus cyanescens TaxID=181874 RepID=A0A409YIV3_9AGAR|nr:hypothetical protein CVT24_012163 [Panaeolus cyanescens]
MPPMPPPAPLLHGNGASSLLAPYQSNASPIPPLGQIPPGQLANLPSAGSLAFPPPSQPRPTPRRANQGGSSTQQHDENIDPSLRFQPNNFGHYFTQSNHTLPGSFYHNHNHHQPPPPSGLQSQSIGQAANHSEQFYQQNSVSNLQQNASLQQGQGGASGAVEHYSSRF